MGRVFAGEPDRLPESQIRIVRACIARLEEAVSADTIEGARDLIDGAHAALGTILE